MIKNCNKQSEASLRTLNKSCLLLETHLHLHNLALYPLFSLNCLCVLNYINYCIVGPRFVFLYLFLHSYKYISLSFLYFLSSSQSLILFLLFHSHCLSFSSLSFLSYYLLSYIPSIDPILSTFFNIFLSSSSTALKTFTKYEGRKIELNFSYNSRPYKTLFLR